MPERLSNLRDGCSLILLGSNRVRNITEIDCSRLALQHAISPRPEGGVRLRDRSTAYEASMRSAGGNIPAEAGDAVLSWRRSHDINWSAYSGRENR